MFPEHDGLLEFDPASGSGSGSGGSSGSSGRSVSSSRSGNSCSDNGKGSSR